MDAGRFAYASTFRGTTLDSRLSDLQVLVIFRFLTSVSVSCNRSRNLTPLSFFLLESLSLMTPNIL